MSAVARLLNRINPAAVSRRREDRRQRALALAEYGTATATMPPAEIRELMGDRAPPLWFEGGKPPEIQDVARIHRILGHSAGDQLPLFPGSGCHARAYLNLVRLRAMNLPASIWFCEGRGDDLLTPEYVRIDRDRPVAWAWHVAVGVPFKSNRGLTRTAIFDPLVFNAPMEPDDWSTALGGRPEIEIVKIDANGAWQAPVHEHYNFDLNLPVREIWKNIDRQVRHNAIKSDHCLPEQHLHCRGVLSPARRPLLP